MLNRFGTRSTSVHVQTLGFLPGMFYLDSYITDTTDSVSIDLVNQALKEQFTD